MVLLAVLILSIVRTVLVWDVVIVVGLMVGVGPVSTQILFHL